MLKRYFADRDFAALLFDFDGTIADTMPAHFASWNHVLALHKVKMSREQHQAWAGQPTREIVKLLNEMHLTNMAYEDISRDKEDYYLRSLPTVKEITPVGEIIRHYHGRLPMAIVSGSRHKAVDLALAQLGLTKYFGAVICAEDYVQGKPAPEGFLKAAACLNVKPENCLVFEDADLGLEAARRAGMVSLRVVEDPNETHKLIRES